MIGNQLAAGTALTIANDSFSGNGSTTAFTLSQSVGAATDIEVLVDNVQQSPYDSSYSVSGTTLTFSGAPATGTNNIYVIYHASKHISTEQVVPDDGSVVEAKLGAAAVTEAKLGNLAVTSAKLHSTLDLSGTGRTGHGGLKSVQVIESSGTYTKPAGINTVRVTVTGGGGQGGGYGAANDYGAGGGAGGTAIKVIDVSGISTVSVTIGAGGNGAAATSNGNGGGASSFGSHCTGGGGGGGKHGNVGPVQGGSGGSGTGGDINIDGGDGGNGVDNDYVPSGNNYRAAENGGASFWGGGGRGASYNQAARGGQAFGTGGGAGSASNGSAGASGKEGVVYVEEFA